MMAVFGRLGAVLGHLGGILGRLSAVAESSWGGIGAVLVPSWDVLKAYWTVLTGKMENVQTHGGLKTQERNW